MEKKTYSVGLNFDHASHFINSALFLDKNEEILKTRMKLLCMLKYIVKQHNIHVHDNITQFSINLI